MDHETMVGEQGARFRDLFIEEHWYDWWCDPTYPLVEASDLELSSFAKIPLFWVGLGPVDRRRLEKLASGRDETEVLSEVIHEALRARCALRDGRSGRPIE